jgi:hypothetical protein
VVQAWGIDLTRFQFDNGQSWAAFILNVVDGTVYGRYGSRSEFDASKHNSLEGFKKALREALRLHSEYPGCKSALKGKKSLKVNWRFPQFIPENKGKYRQLTTDRRGCLCCHCVQSGDILSRRNLRMPIDDSRLWVFPMPDLLGLGFDRTEMATVRTVAPGSEAEEAGFQKGDRLITMAGQPIISIADVQWILHTLRDPARVRATVRRGDATVDLELELPKGWRRRSGFAWRRATWPLRQKILGLVLEVLPSKERKPLGLEDVVLALRIKNVTPPNVKGSNQDANAIGLRKGDVIIGVDGKRKPMNESDLLAYVIQNRPPGRKVVFSVLRGGKRLRFVLTVK